jgi:hypothetical protein
VYQVCQSESQFHTLKRDSTEVIANYCITNIFTNILIYSILINTHINKIKI